MTTPTPMKHGPSQQGRTPSQLAAAAAAAATPPVSTPFSNPAHAAFSPRGTKSSPQQFKKSPAASALPGNTSSLGAFNFDSPSATAALSALGMGNGFDIGLDNVGAGVGGLDGFTAMDREADTLRRLDTIQKIIGDKPALLSHVGLKRLAQRIGFELLSEDQTLPDGRKQQTLVIAGSAISLDIVLENNIFRSLSLAYHGSGQSVSSTHMANAGDVLRHDLHLTPHQSPLTKYLGPFAANFERLAILDKLSITPGLDCHEALAGIYQSLERLHEYDMSKLRQDPAMAAASDQHLASVVMCAKNGFPVMHARGKIGLALQYWKDLHMVPLPPGPLAEQADKDDKVWSLILSCAPMENPGLPPVRVSDEWISHDIVRDVPSISPGAVLLDWLEPPSISLPPADDDKEPNPVVMDILQPDLSTRRVPRVTFTVTFDPPVILPQNDLARLYAHVDAAPPTMELGPGGVPFTYDTLLFPPSSAHQESSEPRIMARRRERQVRNKERQLEPLHHRNRLFVYKPIYSHKVSQLAFSHPRQVIEMLPLVRQYAFLSRLLDKSFGSQTLHDDNPTRGISSSRGSRPLTREEKYAEFMAADAPPAATSDPQTTLMDVIVWVQPLPHLQVTFPVGEKTAHIVIKILERGTVELVDANIFNEYFGDEESMSEERKTLKPTHLGPALERCEDLDQWAAWIRHRLLL